ncbi:xaa-Pro aminopeptidase 3 [Calliopsis andreniformis]|uniref:xaa-Pro aminopeptidase 3 n=1 Tax=Calliopsis andreniformis TaxID=337506 RepID=UPI003FCD0B58
MLNTIRNCAAFQLRKYGQRRYIRYSINKFTNNLNQRQAEDSSVVCSQACGQPTPITHPHLMKDGEIVPGIQLYEVKTRRDKLIESIISHTSSTNVNKSHIIILPSSSKVYMSDKIPYVFRQNTNFLYFTGCQEPDCVLVITSKNENFVTTLFMRQQDEHSELWDGPRTKIAAAPKIFGVDSALPITEFDHFFTSFINENKKSTIWYDNIDIAQPNLHRQLLELLKMNNGQTFVSPMNIIHKIRLIKSQSEIDLMKKSCKIISAAISRTIEMSKPKMSEHQLFAIVDYECRMNGAEYLAYPPVVAAGKNANIIHYISNNQIIQNGDMVLMDAGCEYHGYSSDVTRTWPINGTFNQEQKTLYSILLEIQSSLIHKLKEMPSLDQLFHDMCSLLGKRLQEIGLIPKHLSKEKLLSAAYTYCPHHVSHYLGMDVHDTGKISRSIRLQPGMIITIEPGIYVNPKNRFAPPEFYGLGIRVEDDVLITESGPIVLTKDCPKEINEIEALASQSL